jgi:hypothetical protein
MASPLTAFRPKTMKLSGFPADRIGVRWDSNRRSRPIRPRERLLPSLGLVALAAGAFLVAGASPAWAHKQTPILECVFHDTGTGQYNSVWGYNNSAGSVQTIPIGTSNGFSPNPQNRGQPTAFQPRQNDNVFVVTWNGAGSLTWSLNGQNVSAVTTSSPCAKNPVPLFGPQTILWVAAALACAGVVVVRRRRRATRSSA